MQALTRANIPMNSKACKGAQLESGPCRPSEFSQSEAPLILTSQAAHSKPPYHTCVTLLCF